MVDLVLEDSPHQLIALVLHGAAVDIETCSSGIVGSLDESVLARDREAALFELPFP